MGLKMKTFDVGSFGIRGETIRVVYDDDGKPWFVLRDIARAMFQEFDLANMSEIPPVWVDTKTLDDGRDVAVASERGVLYYIVRSVRLTPAQAEQGKPSFASYRAVKLVEWILTQISWHLEPKEESNLFYFGQAVLVNRDDKFDEWESAIYIRYLGRAVDAPHLVIRERIPTPVPFKHCKEDVAARPSDEGW